MRAIQRGHAPRFLLIFFEGKSTMGMTDQRGDWRRVATDGHGHRQAAGEGEAAPGDEARRSAAPAGDEPCGIRLLADCGAEGRPQIRAADPTRGSGPEPRPIEPPGQVERSRQLRSDEAHAPRLPGARGQAERGPGPLSARMASRQRRVSPGRAGDDPGAGARAS